MSSRRSTSMYDVAQLYCLCIGCVSKLPLRCGGRGARPLLSDGRAATKPAAAVAAPALRTAR